MDTTGQEYASSKQIRFRWLRKDDGTQVLQVSDGGRFGDGAEVWKTVPTVRAADAPAWREGW